MSKLTELLKKKPEPVVEAKSVVPKATISFERKHVEINGINFELLKSDADILEDAFVMVENGNNLDLNDDKAVRKYLKDMSSYIDTVLGVGAMAKISGGNPVGFKQLQECIVIVGEAVYKAYQTDLAAKYGI